MPNYGNHSSVLLLAVFMALFATASALSSSSSSARRFVTRWGWEERRMMGTYQLGPCTVLAGDGGPRSDLCHGLFNHLQLFLQYTHRVIASWSKSSDWLVLLKAPLALVSRRTCRVKATERWDRSSNSQGSLESEMLEGFVGVCCGCCCWTDDGVAWRGSRKHSQANYNIWPSQFKCHSQ